MIAIVNPLENTLVIGEKLRAGVEAIAWEKSIHVTVSIGVAEFRREDAIDSFRKRADCALYSPKRNGKNRVETVPSGA